MDNMDDNIEINALEIASMARALGWGKFCLFAYDLPPDDLVSENKLSIWMECREWSTNSDDIGLFLQINLRDWANSEFAMCVYALRYRICTGWRPFVVAATQDDRQTEVNRLSPFFHASHFTSQENRRLYKKSFPRTANYSWKRVREEGVPEL